jgi:hypothetical protein
VGVVAALVGVVAGAFVPVLWVGVVWVGAVPVFDFPGGRGLRGERRAGADAFVAAGGGRRLGADRDGDRGDPSAAVGIGDLQSYVVLARGREGDLGRGRGGRRRGASEAPAV